MISGLIGLESHDFILSNSLQIIQHNFYSPFIIPNLINMTPGIKLTIERYYTEYFSQSNKIIQSIFSSLIEDGDLMMDESEPSISE